MTRQGTKKAAATSSAGKKTAAKKAAARKTTAKAAGTKTATASKKGARPTKSANATKASKSATRPAAKVADGGKSARTRARILDAAASVMARHGYAGTRLSGVAAEAHIQAPAIYYYFASREALVEEVMYAGIARMREHVEAAVDQLPADTPPLDRIAEAISAHLRYELEESDYARAAVRNAQMVPEDLRARYTAEASAYGTLWTRLIMVAASEGALRPDVDASIARMLVLGALNWTPEWWAPGRASVDTLVEQAQGFVRRGIGA